MFQLTKEEIDSLKCQNGISNQREYPAIVVKEFQKSHDRFLIMDNQVYLIGASLKDLGKKWFSVSLMSETDPEMLLSKM